MGVSNPTDPFVMKGYGRARRWRSMLWYFALVSTLAAIMGTWVAWEAMQRTGRTPAELFDYADRRMEGHPKVEWLAAPMMAVLRKTFDAPALKERLAMPFNVPPPPPRRGAGDIVPPDPVPPGATIWRVGPSGSLTQIAEAARRAKDGDVVEIEAGDYYGDVASWGQKRLTIRGVNGAARLFAAGKIAEDKAIWVFKDGQFKVSNIDFIGARATDGNGAGIRLERGRLHLRGCLFWDNEMGLLTAGVPYAHDTSLEIEASEFAYSHVKGRWGHNLYVGAIDRLRVSGSHFHHAYRGHLLKSRAAVNEILFNRLTDEPGGAASYEANFPNGGQVLMVGNILQQPQTTENGIMISYGEEGYRQSDNAFVLASNTLVNDHTHGGAFLRLTPGPVRISISNNLLVGHGSYQVPQSLRPFNDRRADWRDLARPSRQDYRIRADARSYGYRLPPDAKPGDAVVPAAQYFHPRMVRSLNGVPRLVGADQRTPH